MGFLYKDELHEERKYILRDWKLERVVELSPKCFQPYTEQQTAVLFIRRSREGTSSYLYNRVKNDGFSQDGYRVPLPGENDIDRTIDGDGEIEYSVSDYDENKFKRIQFSIHSDSIPLHEVATVTAGTGNISPKTKIADVHNGIYPVMMVADLAKYHIDYHLTESTYRLTEQAVQRKKPHLFPRNTILIPTTGKASLKNHRALLGVDAYATSTLTGIKSIDDKIHPYVLFFYFLRFDIEHVTYDLGYPGITATVLRQLLIPNYTDKQQDQIIAEIATAVELHKNLKQKHAEVLDTFEPS